jgi:hypothetical protein
VDFPVIQLIGAAGFGAIVGWYVYYINRYREGGVQFSDLVTVIGILGGATVLAIFPQGSGLFGAYGIGLFIGFFGYFLVLLGFVSHTPNFDVDWFLDGRRVEAQPPYHIPDHIRRPQSPGMAGHKGGGIED